MRLTNSVFYGSIENEGETTIVLDDQSFWTMSADSHVSAFQGDLSHVDLAIRDIVRNPAATLDPSLTAANYGNLAEDATPADLAAGTVNLVLQIGRASCRERV